MPDQYCSYRTFLVSLYLLSMTSSTLRDQKLHQLIKVEGGWGQGVGWAEKSLPGLTAGLSPTAFPGWEGSSFNADGRWDFYFYSAPNLILPECVIFFLREGRNFYLRKIWKSRQWPWIVSKGIEKNKPHGQGMREQWEKEQNGFCGALWNLLFRSINSLISVLESFAFYLWFS